MPIVGSWTINTLGPVMGRHSLLGFTQIKRQNRAVFNRHRATAVTVGVDNGAECPPGTEIDRTSPAVLDRQNSSARVTRACANLVSSDSGRAMIRSMLPV